MKRDCLSLAKRYEKKEKAAILRDTGQFFQFMFWGSGSQLLFRAEQNKVKEQ